MTTARILRNPPVVLAMAIIAVAVSGSAVAAKALTWDQKGRIGARGPRGHAGRGMTSIGQLGGLACTDHDGDAGTIHIVTDESDTVTMRCESTALTPPTSVVMTSPASNEVDLTWQPVSEDSDYYYFIKAVNGSTTSSSSAVAGVTTPPGVGAVLAPTVLCGGGAPNRTLTVSFTKAAGTTEYVAYVGASSNGAFPYSATAVTSPVQVPVAGFDTTFWVFVREIDGAAATDSVVAANVPGC